MLIYRVVDNLTCVVSRPTDNKLQYALTDRFDADQVNYFQRS